MTTALEPTSPNHASVYSFTSPDISSSSSLVSDKFCSLVHTLKANVDTESLAEEYYACFEKDAKFVTLQLINDLLRLSGFDDSITSIDNIQIDDVMNISENPIIFKPKMSEQLGNFLFKLFRSNNGRFMFKNNFYIKLIDFVKKLMKNGWDSFRALASILGMKIITSVLYLDELQHFDIIWPELYLHLIRQGLKDYSISVIYNILNEFEIWAKNHYEMLKRPDLQKYLNRSILYRNKLIRQKGYDIVNILAQKHSQDVDFLNLFKFAKVELLASLNQKGLLKELNIKTLYYLSEISDKLNFNEHETELLFMSIFNSNSTVGTYAAKYFYETQLKGNSILTMLKDIVLFSKEAHVKNNHILADSFSWFFIKSDLIEEWKTLIIKDASPASYLLHSVVKRIVSNEPPEIRKSTSKTLHKVDRIKFNYNFTSNFPPIWFELIESRPVLLNEYALKYIISIVQYFDPKLIDSQIWFKLIHIFLKTLSFDIANLSCRMMDFLEKKYTWDGHQLNKVLRKKNYLIETSTKDLMDYLDAPLSLAYEPVVLEKICAVFTHYSFDDNEIWFHLVNVVKSYNSNYIRYHEQIKIIMIVMFELMFRRYTEMKSLVSSLKKIDENDLEYFNIQDEYISIEIDLLPRIYELELHFTPVLDPSFSFETRRKAFFYLSRLFRNCGPHMFYGEDSLYTSLFLNFDNDFPKKLKLLAMECLCNICKENNKCCKILDNFLSLIGDGFVKPNLLQDFIIHLGENDLHNGIIIKPIINLLKMSGLYLINFLAQIIFNVISNLYNESASNIDKAHEILSILFGNLKTQNGVNFIHTVHKMVIEEVKKRENDDFILLIVPFTSFLDKNCKNSIRKELSDSNKSSEHNVSFYISHLK